MPALSARLRPSRMAGLAVAGLLAGAAAALLRRRRGPAAAGGPAATAVPGEREWQCACGQAFRIAGVERHRVFWLAGSPKHEPVLGDRCPACDRPLPAAA
jgi:hypothetical protein